MKIHKILINCKKLIFVAAALALVTSPLSSSQASQVVIDSHEKTIKISAEQQKRLLDAQAAYIEKTIQLEAEADIAQNKENRILAGLEIDFQVLRKHVKTSSEKMAQLEMMEIDALEEIKSILDVDQWKWYLRSQSLFGPESIEFELAQFPGCCREMLDVENYSDILVDEVVDFTPFTLLLHNNG